MIRLRAETGEAFAADVSLWLIQVDKDNIDAQVELQPLQCHWIRNIPLNYHVVRHDSWQVSQILKEQTIISLGATLGLRDEDRVWTLSFED